jgi:hypothetical protein
MGNEVQSTSGNTLFRHAPSGRNFFEAVVAWLIYLAIAVVAILAFLLIRQLIRLCWYNPKVGLPLTAGLLVAGFVGFQMLDSSSQSSRAATQTYSSFTSNPMSSNASSARAATRTAADASSKLEIGANVEVVDSGDCLNAREAPNRASQINKCLVDGTVAHIEDGPVVADSYRWWKLEGYGWAVDQWLRRRE